MSIVLGAAIMLIGLTFGWAMAVTQHKRENHNVNIVISDKKKEAI